MEPVEHQERLFNAEQFGNTCTKCGHGKEEHNRYGGMCRGMVGHLECKCSSFAHNPPIPRPAE